MKEEEKQDFAKSLENSKIKDVKVEDEMKKSFIAYAMAVNVSRAIPDVRDGLKPVHRRILYAMNELGLSNDKPFRKCARIVGDVLGKYHPHGDTAVYDALVRLAQDFSIRCPLVEGHGNFGSVDGDPPAAQRYTEARLSKISAEMLRDIDKKTVDYYPNFDDTLEQPTVLPARYPNLLVNGSDGIAVGMATSIPPHNLGEVIDGTVALIENPDITIEELMQYIPAPDYPTGGLVLARNSIKEAYRTGRGSAIIRAKTEIETAGEHHNRDRIIITEIPYQVNKAQLIENMATQVKDKRIEGIADIKEESDREGMRIVIDIKKDANAQVVLNTLFKQTALQVSNSMIMLALQDGVPKIMNLKEILVAYVKHQEDVVTRRTKFDLERAEERAHILRGLVIAEANIDEVVQIIKTSETTDIASERLMSTFELSEKQANAILEMKLRRLTSLEVDKLTDELAEKERLIVEYREILGDITKIRDIIKTEMLEIKEKYNTPRRAEITYDYSDIDIADLIEKQDIIVSMTHEGYIKRMAVSEYKSQRRGGMGITAHKAKEDDFIENMFVTNTHIDLLFFTNMGKVYTMKGYEIPEAQRMARGRAIINLLQLDGGEKVTAFLPLPEDSEHTYLTLATKNGLIKKTDMKEFASIRKGGKIAINLVGDDELIGATLTNGEEDIIVATKQGKCIRFNENDIRSMGRDTMGVRSIKLEKGDTVIDMSKVADTDEILTISSEGYGKRTSPDDYRTQTRGGKGIKAGVFNDKTGELIGLKVITDEESDVMIICDNGVVIRIHSDEISKIGRNTQGVRLMKMKEDAKAVMVAVVPRDDEEEVEGGSEETEKTTEETTAETTVAEENSAETEANEDENENE